MKTAIPRTSQIARTSTLLLAMIAAAPLAPAQDAAATEPAAQQAQADVVPTAQAEQGAFTAEVRAQGRYSAAALGSVSYEPERYSGELVVAEVVTPQGRVSPGSVVVRLEAPDMEEQLGDAEEALKRAEDRLRWAIAEREMSDIEREIADRNRAQSLADLEASFERFEAFGKEDSYTRQRLEMESTEASLADAAEELRQLEELYEGARLASRTQDIVLERARRRLAMQQQMAEITRRNHETAMTITLPNRERDLIQRLEAQRLAAVHAERRFIIAQEQQAIAWVEKEEAVDNAAAALEELRADAESLALTSDTGGVIVSAITLEPGDQVSARQAIATLQSHDRGTITMSIDANDLRTLREGDTVAIRWRPFAEVESAGTVRTIAWQGQGSGSSTSYSVTIDIADVADVVRPGMLADITATRELDNTLSVPKDAVARDEDGAYVMLQDGDTFTRRDVVTGALSADRIQIIQGLDEGDTVRVPAN